MTTGNIGKANTAIDFERAKELFEEYAGTLNFDLGYQDFRKELESIDQQYAPPAGALLLYLTDDEIIAGCAGIRSFAEGSRRTQKAVCPAGLQRPEDRQAAAGGCHRYSQRTRLPRYPA